MAKAGANATGKSRGNSRVEPRSDDGFWDRPMLINLLADLLLLAGGILLTWAGALALQRLPVLPLTQLVVVRPLDQVARAQIEQTARTALSGNFLTVNLDTAQAAFERMPWVRSASLRRHWPDGIELDLEEHRAAAHWTPQEGESRLVSTRGEVFIASTREPLPVFAGPEGSAPRLLARYREFSDSLAAIGRKQVAIHLSAREAWQLKLDNGVVLELGRDQLKAPLAERLARFTSHYPAVSNSARSRLQAIGAVDMRYPNGFALRGIAVLSPEEKLRPPPPFPRPGAGVTGHLPRLAGGVGGNSRSTAARHRSRLAMQSKPWSAGRGCRQCQAHAADALAEAA